MVAKKEHYLKSKCPVACALDIIGDHWTLLIVRDLMFMEKHEYKELLESDEGISSNILSDRLKKLEDSGIIAVAAHPDSKLRKLYHLTDTGKDLINIMLDIAVWSDKHLGKRVFIPDEKRPFLDNPRNEVVTLVMKQLEDWESKNLV